MGLSEAEEREVIRNSNVHSDQLNYDPLELLLTGAGTKPEIMTDFREGFENQLRSDLQNQNGEENPLTNVLLPFALETQSRNSRISADGLTVKEALVQYIDEPMKTIMLLKSHPDTDVKKRGSNLLKKAIARCLNFNTHEEREKCRAQRGIQDSNLMDMMIDKDTSGVKDFMVGQALSDTSAHSPLITTALNRNIAGLDLTNSISSNSDLFKNQFASKTFQSQINQVAPNDAYLMFKFIHDSSAKNDGRIPAQTILDIAFGSDVLDIKAEDFKANFGVSGTDFICAAHEHSLRVPCMVNQATVTQPMCAEKGCCYNRVKEDGNGYVDPNKVPICYMNVLGKVGAGIARHMIKEDHIIGLFGGLEHWPQLTDLTEANSWAESQMPEILRRLVKEPGNFYGNPRGQGDWWGNMYDSESGFFNLFPTHEPPRRENFEWKPHGPTAMPGAAHVNIPEIGGFLSGSDPRAKELDFVIGNHVNKVRGQLNSQSYTCQLIQPEHMNDCFPHNFAALSTEAEGKDPAAACEELGCCYNELNLFAEPTLPVCYRSLRSGYCDAPIADRGTGTREDIFWRNHPIREHCGGADGHNSRMSCLKNPTCCFDTNPRREGDSFCYRRGGVEGQINPYTRSKGEAIDECLTIPLTQRVACFPDTSKFGKLLNRIATQTQCDALGCCFDEAAAAAAAKMSLFGSMTLAAPHCYKGPEDLDSTYVNSNYRKLPRYNINQLVKVCAGDPKWPKLKQMIWETGPNGRPQLKEQDTEREISREPCLHQGKKVTDRHQCIYTLGCCFEKSSNPINPWCYQSRLVVNN